MSTFAAKKFSDVMTDARLRLNDAAIDIYTDAILISFAADAHGELEDEYAKHDIDLLEHVVDTFSYTADATTIAVPIAITDLQEPLEIFQRLSAADPWVEVTRRTEQAAPTILEPQYLGSWEWSENVIKVNPATSNLELLVRYRRLLDYPVANTTLGFENLYWPLVWGTAYLAAIPTQRAGSISYLEKRYFKRLQDSILIESRRLQGDASSFQKWSGSRSSVALFKTK